MPAMRYRLRTLLILLAILPPLLAGAWWKYSAWQAEQARQKSIEAEKARIQELIDLTTW
jgi:hypothetical protein